MERLGDFLFRHVEGIAAYCDHPVRFGVVESINTTIKAVLRRARGMRDERTLLLKLKWATAHPIQSFQFIQRYSEDWRTFSTNTPLHARSFSLRIRRTSSTFQLLRPARACTAFSRPKEGRGSHR